MSGIEQGVGFPITATDQFSGAFDKLVGKLGSAQSQFERLSGTIASLGAGLGVGAFAGFVKSTIDALDHLNDLSKSTNITAADLAGLSLAARQSGSDLDATAKAVNVLSQNMGKNAEKFAALGVSAREPLEALKQLADQFVASNDVQLRNAVLSEALGKNWQELAPLLAEGGKRIGEMVDRGRELSGVTQGMVEQADALNDKWVMLTGTGRTMISVVGPLLPLLNSVLDSLIKLRDESAQAAGGGGFHLIAEAFRALVVLGANVAFVFRGIGLEIGGVMAQLSALATGDFARFAEIGRTMRADAEANRAAFDAWEKGFMGIATAASAATKAIDAGDQVSRRIANEADARNRAFTAGTEKRKTVLKEHTKVVREDNSELEAAVHIYQQLMKLGADRVLQITDQLEREKIELDLIGKNNVERAVALLQLEKTISLRGVIDDAQRRTIEGLYEERKALILVREAREESFANTTGMWHDLADGARDFAQSVRSVGDAYDWLKNKAIQIGRDILSIFAQKIILNIGAAVTSGAASSALASSAANTGAGTLAGNAVSSLGGNAAASWVGGLFGGGTAAVGTIGAAGSTAIGAGAVGGSAGIGAGAAGTASFGGSAGMMAGVYEALAAIPVWGWIAMAVIAIGAWIAGNHKGGPKVGGSFMGSFDSTGALTGNQAVPGTDNGRFFTPNQLDKQTQELVERIGKGFGGLLTRFGGKTSGDFSFGLGFDHDPNGTAQSRVSSMVRDARGNIIYRVADRGMDDKEVPQALLLEGQRMVLAALQASQLPPAIAAILKTVNAATASQEQIGAVFELADAFVTLTEALSSMTAADIVSEASKTATDRFMEHGNALIDLAGKTDITVESLRTLTSATLDYKSAAQQLILAFENAKRQIDDMFGATSRNIRLAGMNDQQKYNFYQTEAEKLLEQALKSNDASEIQRLAGLINQDINAAFALLSPGQQGAMQQDWLSRIDETNRALQDHLSKLQGEAQDELKKVLDEIKKIMEDNATDLKAAGADIRAGGSDIRAGAGQPLRVDVHVYDDRTDAIINDGG